MYFKQVLQNEKSSEIKTVLMEQKKKYDFLKQQSFFQPASFFLNDNKLVLPPDALIHGTKFDILSLSAIKKEGILASEFSMLKPDSDNETFYMADFFKNVTGESLAIKDLLTCFNKHNIIHYLPDVEKVDTTKRVAFVVNTQNEMIKNYVKLDLFSENNSSLLPFIDEEMYFCIERRKRMHHYNYKLGQTSIPIGVPYNALSAIIVDKEIEENKNQELDVLKTLFGKDLYIVSVEGELLNTPEKNEKEEITL